MKCPSPQSTSIWISNVARPSKQHQRPRPPPGPRWRRRPHRHPPLPPPPLVPPPPGHQLRALQQHPVPSHWQTACVPRLWMNSLANLMCLVRMDCSVVCCSNAVVVAYHRSYCGVLRALARRVLRGSSQLRCPTLSSFARVLCRVA